MFVPVKKAVNDTWVFATADFDLKGFTEFKNTEITSQLATYSYATKNHKC